MKQVTLKGFKEQNHSVPHLATPENNCFPPLQVICRNITSFLPFMFWCLFTMGDRIQWGTYTIAADEMVLLFLPSKCACYKLVITTANPINFPQLTFTEPLYCSTIQKDLRIKQWQNKDSKWVSSSPFLHSKPNPVTSIFFLQTK